MDGQLSETGEINAEYTSGTTIVGKMTGTMTEFTASGTWESSMLRISGTWKGSKQ